MLPNIKLLFEYFQDKSEYLWVQELLESALFFNTAAAMQTNSIRIARTTNTGYKYKIPNFMAFIFARPSSGKNYSMELTQDIFRPLFESFVDSATEFVTSSNNHDEEGKLQRCYIKISSPYIPVTSTAEGIQKYAQTVDSLGRGSVNIITDELGSVITRMDSIFTKMKQGFDYGTAEGNILSTDTESYHHVQDISFNALLMGSPEVFHIDPKLKQLLLMAYVSGMARRAFIFYDAYYKKSENRNPNFETLSTDKLQEAQTYINKLNKFIRTTKQIILPKEIKQAITDWDIEKDAIRETSNSPIKEDLGNPNKIERLLGIIATLDLSPTIEQRHLDYAINYSDRMDKVAEDSIKLKPFYEQIYEELESREFMSRSEIVKHVAGITAKNLSEEMTLTKEYASEKGHTIVTKEYDNIVKYRLEKLRRTKLNEVIYSVSLNTDPHDPSGFIKRVQNFEKLKNVASNNIKYSAGTFIDNYITNDNYLKEQNLLIFDIDNYLSIAEVKSLLFGLVYMLATTKSHKKEKHGIVAERFRIFIPTKSIFHLAPRDYSRMYKNIMKILALDMADSSCSNASRWYYGTTSANTFFNLQGELFDVRPYIEDAKENQDVDKAIAKVDFSNVDDETIQRKLNGAYRWFFARSPDNERNTNLFAFGAMMKEHFPTLDYVSEMTRFNSMFNEPLGQAEFNKIANSIAKRVKG